MGLRGLLANDPPALARVQGKLQALLYDMLPSTTAVFSYTIGSENCQPTSSFCCCCCWYSSSSKFVTNNSNYIRRLFYVAMLLTPAQIKPKPFETRRNFFFFFFFTRGGFVSCLRACALCTNLSSLPRLSWYNFKDDVNDRMFHKAEPGPPLLEITDFRRRDLLFYNTPAKLSIAGDRGRG